MHVLVIIISIVLIYFLSITVAWLINRRELKRLYGRAPFNYRIYGWIFTYVPYLQKLQANKPENTKLNGDTQ